MPPIGTRTRRALSRQPHVLGPVCAAAPSTFEDAGDEMERTVARRIPAVLAALAPIFRVGDGLA